MNRKKYPTVNIGSASMLVIFITLCLAVFSVLALSSARSDYSYSERIAERTRTYYDACNQAETLLEIIDEAARAAYEEDSASFPGNAVEQLTAETFSEHMREALGTRQTESAIKLLAEPGEEAVISFQIPVNESQALYVRLTLQERAEKEAAYYRIDAWQEISTREWGADEPMNLW